MKPNIFNIAIKEFHQDAFITWLLQWSDPNNKELDEQLFLCGQEFIKSLISTQYKGTISNFIKVEAGRQWENIDIWAEVYTQNENYLIIIEDKTFTSEHSDQLTKYKKIGEDYCKGKKFNLVCIYLKTGDEPERILNSIQKKGFTIFNRKDFIHLLDKYKKIKNNIFQDFVEYLLNIELSYNSFENRKISEWDDNSWIGFYQFLSKEIKIDHWGKVNNPQGGFWNAGLSDWIWKKNYAIFMQIEQGKLCFKLCTDPNEVDFDENKTDRAILRNEINEFILEKALKANLSEIRRPDRFGNGKYMTVAIVDQNIWLGNDDEIIDKIKTIELLKKYIDFFNSLNN